MDDLLDAMDFPDPSELEWMIFLEHTLLPRIPYIAIVIALAAIAYELIALYGIYMKIKKRCIIDL